MLKFFKNFVMQPVEEETNNSSADTISNIRIETVNRTLKDEIHCSIPGTLDCTVTGSLTYGNNNTISGFGNSNYLRTNSIFNPAPTDTWEINLAFTTSSPSSRQCILNCCYITDRLSFQLNNRKIVLALRSSSNASGWDINDDSNGGDLTVQSNVKYYVRLRYTGSEYTVEYSLDKLNYTLDKTISSSTPIWSNEEYPYIGALYNINGSTWYPCDNCSFDMNEFNFKINNTLIWSGVTAEQIIF